MVKSNQIEWGFCKLCRGLYLRGTQEEGPEMLGKVLATGLLGEYNQEFTFTCDLSEVCAGRRSECQFKAPTGS